MKKIERHYQWTGVDWKDNNTSIANKLGCSRGAVRYRRRKNGYANAFKYHCIEDPNSIKNKLIALNSSNMTLDEVAKTIKCSKHYVKDVFRLNHKSFKRKKNFSTHDWSKITDWTLSNRKISDILVASPNTVRRYRIRMGIPSNPKTRIKYNWSKINDWTTPNKEIAKKLGTKSVSSVSHYRRRLGISRQYKFYNWENVNWNYYDSVISRSVGCPICLVSWHRKKRGMPSKTMLNRNIRPDNKRPK